jgi:hypothetical protein
MNNWHCNRKKGQAELHLGSYQKQEQTPPRSYTEVLRIDNCDSQKIKDPIFDI